MPAPVAQAAGRPPRLARTPSLPLGPYYPVQRQAPARAALWTRAEWPATARQLVLQGRVLDAAGHPLQGAVVEVWHADAKGRYRHANQPDADGIDAAFTGSGAHTTDGTGVWRFASLMPGCYGTAAGLRAPHVHFQVTHGASRLVTQMFFPAHAMNAADRWYRAVAQPERLLGRVMEDGAHGLIVHWDIVMDGPAVEPAMRNPSEEQP